MNAKKQKINLEKVEEPEVIYGYSKCKGVDKETFNFDEEFKKGYTPEQAKAESIRRIREWWIK